MADLKLGKLPDRNPVKLTISVMPDLRSALAGYAVLYEQSYGQKEQIEDLISAMLARFLESDRAFAKARSEAASGGKVVTA